MTGARGRDEEEREEGAGRERGSGSRTARSRPAGTTNGRGTPCAASSGRGAPRPVRSSSQAAAARARSVGSWPVAAARPPRWWPAEVDRGRSVATGVPPGASAGHGRPGVGLASPSHRPSSMFQNDGPTGSGKSPRAVNVPSASSWIGSCGQRPGGRAERRHGAAHDVERGLVAGTDELPLGRAVQADRAPGVGAHLGVGDEPARRP